MTHTPTHTEKGLYGAKEQRVPPTSSFWSKNGRKALKHKGWDTLKKPMRTRETLLLQAAVICGILKQIPQKGELFHYAVQ